MSLLNGNYDKMKELLEKTNKTPKLLKIYIKKYLPNQSECFKIPDGKDFYYVMGYDFLRNWKEKENIVLNKTENIFSSLYGVPIYPDDFDLFKSIFEDK